MTREEYLTELNKAFSKFVFFPEDHHYECNGKRVNISVTRLIEQYANEFDSQTIAERVARKQGKTTQEVLDEWEYKNKFSCAKGSTCHEYIQSLFSGEPYKPIDFDGGDEFWNASEKIKEQAKWFWREYRDRLEHLADEFIIGDEQCSVASAIDHIFINKITGGLVLVDYKTNSDIHKNEKYAKPMKAPLQHLLDTTLNHYSIQLSIYKYLVEKHTDLKFEEMFIVWFSENNDEYQIIEVPYLEKEVKKILEWEMWK